MEDKQKIMMILTMIISIAALVVACVVVFLPKEYEVIVEQHQPITQTTESPTVPTLPPEVNINTAGYTELMRLPGMTEDIVFGIFAYRETYRYFTFPEDLLKVEGVTRTLYDLWYPYIYI